MRIKHIISGQWIIYAVQSERGDCPLLKFLNGLDNSYSGHRDSLLALLEEVSGHAEKPSQWISPKKCHTITTDKKIWQFTVGRLRIAWFYDDGNVIICTHGFFKDSQTTKRADQKQAQKIRDNYFLAKQQKNIKIEKEEEE